MKLTIQKFYRIAGGSTQLRGVLSDIVVSDGKVFFSLPVDAATVKNWEPVRAAAESSAGLPLW